MRSALFACALVSAACGSKPAPKTHHVSMRAMKFEPHALEVAVGDTVVWTNEDLVPHTVTKAGAFDSKAIEPKHEWRYTATASGEFPYLCTMHPGMTGVLFVK